MTKEKKIKTHEPLMRKNKKKKNKKKTKAKASWQDGYPKKYETKKTIREWGLDNSWGVTAI